MPCGSKTPLKFVNTTRLKEMGAMRLQLDSLGVQFSVGEQLGYWAYAH